MSTKAAEKIIDALTQLVEGFAELQERLEEDFDPERAEDESEEDESKNSSLEDALITEVRAAVESVIENEDCAPEDLASVISALTDALEEIAPEVFSQSEEEEEEKDEDEDEDYDDDDDDIDLDDEDYDEDEEDEDEDEEKEEDEDE